MGDCIILDDGRTLDRATIGIGGVISFVADHLPDGHDQFRKWLLDVSERPAGFASIDLRGLPERERRAFHAGVHAAYAQTIGKGKVIGPQSWSLSCLDDLRAMLLSIERGEPPEALTDGVPRSRERIYAEDLSQIWKSEYE